MYLDLDKIDEDAASRLIEYPERNNCLLLDWLAAEGGARLSCRRSGCGGEGNDWETQGIDESEAARTWPGQLRAAETNVVFSPAFVHPVAAAFVIDMPCFKPMRSLCLGYFPRGISVPYQR